MCGGLHEIKNMIEFSEFLKNKTADFFIIDIEDHKSFNRRLIIDDNHYVGSKFDGFRVIESKTIYFENDFLDNGKLKIGIHVTLRKN